MMEVVVTTGAIRRAEPQSKFHHQQTNNTQIGQIKQVEIADKQGAALLTTNSDTKRRR